MPHIVDLFDALETFHAQINAIKTTRRRGPMVMEDINNDEAVTQADATNTNNVNDDITGEGIHYCLAKFGNKPRIDPLFYIGS